MRVCLLGAESTGKTTLARALADAYDDVVEPGVRARVHRGRARARGATWTELGVHPHRPRPLLVRGLSRRARRPVAVLATPTRSRPRCSTSCTSARRRPGSRSSRRGRYDLYLVCGLDVPWKHDGWQGVRRGQRPGCTSSSSSGRARAGRRGSSLEGAPSTRLDGSASTCGGLRCWPDARLSIRLRPTGARRS